MIRNNRESAFTIIPLPTDYIIDKNSKNDVTHDYKEIIFLFSGTGEFKIDDEVIKLKPNTLFFIKKNQFFKILHIKNTVGYSLKYKNEFIPSAGLNYKSSYYSKLNGYISDLKYIEFKKKGMKNLKSHFNVLLKEYYEPEEAFTSKSIVQHLFISLILKIERKARDIVIDTTKGEINNHNKILYTNFLDILEENFMTTHNMDFYADKLSLSRRKLSDLVKEFTGITAKRYLLDRVILEAKRLLAYSNKNLKEICYDLGFEYPAYFSTLFKEITGHTPNQYRKIQQQK
ncbi:AraC family transcriptional regulator [Polaribacter sp. L3A8]|uniref:AraC family transcriptional regulator n=1 Tax=Polaribacter sp. L3A8 TaxID=2686361 RepID=UPI00131CF446|nr:AraC family transcriptional regulator [Polaribacter sp. L3A8]